MSRPDRKAMLDRDRRGLSIRRQCVLLSLARSGVYRRQRPANDDDLVLMRRIDQLFLAWPFLGSRRTTKPQHGHKIFPYLLRDLVIERPNQVWAADITYIPIGRGFLYLVAVIDWFSRAVLAWRLSNTMDAAFCVDALEEALARWGRPEIFNTDQGSQFTGAAFTGTLVAAGIRVSMDGRGRWIDNVFIERLERSLKYEDVAPPTAARRVPESRLGSLFIIADARIRRWATGRRWRSGARASPARSPTTLWTYAARGRRSRVAHVPTATTTATDALRGVIEEGGAGPASNQHRRSGGPTDWVQFTVDSSWSTGSLTPNSLARRSQPISASVWRRLASGCDVGGRAASRPSMTEARRPPISLTGFRPRGWPRSNGCAGSG